MREHPQSPPKYASDFIEGTVLHDYVDPSSGLRILVTRGLVSFCAYVGVQSDHALAGLDTLEFDCHFGITFQDWGQAGTVWPEGWYWWGWDYGHFTDCLELPPDLAESAGTDCPELADAIARINLMLGGSFAMTPGKKWMLSEVFEDAVDVLMNLKTALEQSEKQLRELLHESGVVKPAE